MFSDTQLDMLINHLPGPAHARTTDTCKYFLANQYHVTQQGFSHLNDAIGITPQEVYYHRTQQLEIIEGSLLLETQHRKIVEHLNYQIDQSTEPLYARLSTLFPTGFIAEGILKKVPILGYTRPVVGVFTFFEDRTHTLICSFKAHLFALHRAKQARICSFLR